MNTKINGSVNPPENLQKFPVVEIFGPTLQGEGLTIGQRTVFLRLGGCDYRCEKCDSLHAVDPREVQRNSRKMTAVDIAAELIELCEGNNCKWVTFSGGNPCIWDLSVLVGLLQAAGIFIAVETQGTVNPAWLMGCNYITVSPKGPGMGEKFEPERFKQFLATVNNHYGVSIKIVVFDARDLEFASMVAEMVPHYIAADRFYLSVGNPNPPQLGQEGLQLDAGSSDELLHESIEALKDLVDSLKEYPALKMARVLPQLHTWLWGNDRGR